MFFKLKERLGSNGVINYGARRGRRQRGLPEGKFLSRQKMAWKSKGKDKENGGSDGNTLTFSPFSFLLFCCTLAFSVL